MHSPQFTGQEGIELSSHLAGQGRVAVLCRAVGDHEVGPWRSKERSGGAAQLVSTALHTECKARPQRAQSSPPTPILGMGKLRQGTADLPGRQQAGLGPGYTGPCPAQPLRTPIPVPRQEAVSLLGKGEVRTCQGWAALFPRDTPAKGQPPKLYLAIAEGPRPNPELPSLSWRPLSGLSVKMKV